MPVTATEPTSSSSITTSLSSHPSSSSATVRRHTASSSSTSSTSTSTSTSSSSSASSTATAATSSSSLSNSTPTPTLPASTTTIAESITGAGDAAATTTTTTSTWHTIRPWSPPLTLAVREITSVSVTFSISSPSLEPRNSNQQARSRPKWRNGETLGDAYDGDGNDPDEDGPSQRKRNKGGAQQQHKKRAPHATTPAATRDQNPSSTKTWPQSQRQRQAGSASLSPPSSALFIALAKERLQVSVNGAVWQKVFPHFDENVDEAVIIVYGLMPRRQYDIILSLTQEGHTAQHQITTVEDAFEQPEIHSDSDSATFDLSTSSDQAAHFTPSTSPSPESSPSSNASAPLNPPAEVSVVGSTEGSPAAGPSMSLEERSAQLKITLDSLSSESLTLEQSIKTTRKDGQKHDHQIRSQIDALRKASQKQYQADEKAQRKVLSEQGLLQRAQAVVKETEEKLAEVQDQLPGLESKVKEKEKLHVKLKEGAEKVRKEKEAYEEQEKKKLEVMKGELSTLEHKKEKLGTKQEKLETIVLPGLEQKLKEIELEIQQAEQELEAEKKAAEVAAAALLQKSVTRKGSLGSGVGLGAGVGATEEDALLPLGVGFKAPPSGLQQQDYSPTNSSLSMAPTAATLVRTSTSSTVTAVPTSTGPPATGSLPPLGSPFIPFQRQRVASQTQSQNPGVGAIARPVGPIQRPSPGEIASLHGHSSSGGISYGTHISHGLPSSSPILGTAMALSTAPNTSPSLAFANSIAPQMVATNSVGFNVTNGSSTAPMNSNNPYHVWATPNSSPVAARLGTAPAHYGFPSPASMPSLNTVANPNSSPTTSRQQQQQQQQHQHNRQQRRSSAASLNQFARTSVPASASAPVVAVAATSTQAHAASSVMPTPTPAASSTASTFAPFGSGSAGSTLSSKAPPFEPGRFLKFSFGGGQSQSQGSASNTTVADSSKATPTTAPSSHKSASVSSGNGSSGNNSKQQGLSGKSQGLIPKIKILQRPGSNAVAGNAAASSEAEGGSG